MTTAKYTKLRDSDDKKLKPPRRSRGACICFSIMLVVKGCVVFIFCTVLLLLCSTILVDGYPLHASCEINWTFGVNCTSVSESLVSQIKEWNGPDNCDGGGEKCLYELISVNKTLLTGTHTTPKKGYVDDISFQFTPDGTSCKVFGFSTSQTWYAVLDSGTNYCNLHNLITGSELDKVAGYEEMTSDSKCTQYSSADCDVY